MTVLTLLAAIMVGYFVVAVLVANLVASSALFIPDVANDGEELLICSALWPSFILALAYMAVRNFFRWAKSLRRV